MKTEHGVKVARSTLLWGAPGGSATDGTQTTDRTQMIGEGHGCQPAGSLITCNVGRFAGSPAPRGGLARAGSGRVGHYGGSRRTEPPLGKRGRSVHAAGTSERAGRGS